MKNYSFFQRNLFSFIIFLGIVHPLIAHGIGGEHPEGLTVAQLAYHIFTVGLFHLVYAWQMKQYITTEDLMTTSYPFWLLFIIPHTLFWVGYYTLFIPFDILFMMLAIAAINGFTLKDNFTKPWIWIGANIGLVFVAFLFTAVIAYPVEEWADAEQINVVSKNILIWLIITICISITYCLFTGIVANKLRSPLPSKEVELL